MIFWNPQLCFAEDIQPPPDQEKISTMHLAYGTEKIIEGEWTQALEELQKAQQALSIGNKSSGQLQTSTLLVGFFIAFEQVVAQDVLGNVEQCEKLLNLLPLILEEYALKEAEEEKNSSGFDDYHSTSAHSSVPAFFYAIASLAHSKEVKERLCSIIQKLLRESTFDRIQLSPQRNSRLRFHHSNEISFQKCGAFWRGCEKICEKAEKLLTDLLELYAKAKKIKEFWDTAKKIWDAAMNNDEKEVSKNLKELHNLMQKRDAHSSNVPKEFPLLDETPFGKNKPNPFQEKTIPTIR